MLSNTHRPMTKTTEQLLLDAVDRLNASVRRCAARLEAIEANTLELTLQRSEARREASKS